MSLSSSSSSSSPFSAPAIHRAEPRPPSTLLRQFTMIAATMCFLEYDNTFMDTTFDKEEEQERFNHYLQTTNLADLRATIQHNIREFHSSFNPKKVNIDRLWECLMVILREDQHKEYDDNFWVNMQQYYKDRPSVKAVDKINKGFWSKLAATFSRDLIPLAHFKSPLQLQTAYATGKLYSPPPVTKHNGKGNGKAKAKAKKAAKKIVGK